MNYFSLETNTYLRIFRNSNIENHYAVCYELESLLPAIMVDAILRFKYDNKITDGYIISRLGISYEVYSRIFTYCYDHRKWWTGVDGDYEEYINIIKETVRILDMPIFLPFYL